MIDLLKIQEKFLTDAIASMKKSLCIPKYLIIEGLQIYIGHFWIHPEAEAVYMKTAQILKDVQREIAAKGG